MNDTVSGKPFDQAERRLWGLRERLRELSEERRQIEAEIAACMSVEMRDVDAVEAVCVLSET